MLLQLVQEEQVLLAVELLTKVQTQFFQLLLLQGVVVQEEKDQMVHQEDLVVEVECHLQEVQEQERHLQ